MYLFYCMIFVCLLSLRTDAGSGSLRSLSHVSHMSHVSTHAGSRACLLDIAVLYLFLYDTCICLLVSFYFTHLHLLYSWVFHDSYLFPHVSTMSHVSTAWVMSLHAQASDLCVPWLKIFLFAKCIYFIVWSLYVSYLWGQTQALDLCVPWVLSLTWVMSLRTQAEELACL